MDVVTTVDKLPVLCTRGMVVFPGQEVSLDVGRSFSLKALEDAINEYDSKFIFVSQINPYDESCSFDNIYHYATICKVVRRIKRDNHGTIKLTTQGIQRVELLNLDLNDAYYAEYKVIEDVEGDKIEEQALVRRLTSYLDDASRNLKFFPRDALNQIQNGLTASELSDVFAQYLNIELRDKVNILKEANINERLLSIIASLEQEQAIAEAENKINAKVKENVDKNQKEYYLREKLHAIKEELGDAPSKEDDTDYIREKIKKEPYPEHIVKKLEEELKRYDMMPSGSQEASVIRTYIDWVMKTPWYKETKDQQDIKEVERILDEDHFGLEKPKERIVEHLAVKQMTNSLNAPIICLVGPPGVGKTSISKSIARALNREFVKASLGGVRDEAEIRGHRRTYLGSMPGRIIQGMKKAGVVNPVFLLDEIDKMSSDFKGDPTSAMLEVLDPEQNSMFSDNYIEEPYDLSKVLFIATANDLGSIPGPLRDRLEIIELSSYTEHEKLQIAKRHLIKKQLELHGLKEDQLTIDDDTILYIIRHYTREAGVRQLERLIAKICRKAVLSILKDENKHIVVSKDNLEDYLSKAPFDHTKMLSTPQVGVVTGMAYTQYGGDILPIEVNHFEGTGKFVITGQLGDVMKESASIALDYIKAHKKEYGLDKVEFDKEDIHIHVPEGAVKKDGPSAGVTLTTAIYSAFSNKKVRNDVAMTGEVTLTGNVLPIGGLKEKSISAHRSGIKTIIIPKDNEKDIEDIPETVRNDLEIVLADHVNTVFETAFVK